MSIYTMLGRDMQAHLLLLHKASLPPSLCYYGRLAAELNSAQARQIRCTNAPCIRSPKQRNVTHHAAHEKHRTPSSSHTKEKGQTHHNIYSRARLLCDWSIIAWRYVGAYVRGGNLASFVALDDLEWLRSTLRHVVICWR